MKRRLPGISATTVDESRPAIPDGIYLVRLDHAQHRWQAGKPFYLLRLVILEPTPFADLAVASRLYCTPKAMWKLGWFLRDFLYDPESLSRDEIDERALNERKKCGWHFRGRQAFNRAYGFGSLEAERSGKNGQTWQ